jgi:hypothetical protein
MESALSKALAPLDNQKDTKVNPLPLKPCNYALIGRKGCGKTTLLLNLLERKESPWHKAFDLIFLVSPTASRDDKMKELVDDLGDQYYDTLDNSILQEIMDRIDAHTDERKKKKKRGKPAYAIIYDDCIHLIKGKQSRLMDLLATQNRHRNVTNIYLLQKYNGFLPTLIRSNLDMITYFKTDNKKELDSFLEEQNADENVLRKLYEYATADPYTFLHINNYYSKPVYYKRFDEIKFQKKDLADK